LNRNKISLEAACYDCFLFKLLFNFSFNLSAISNEKDTGFIADQQNIALLLALQCKKSPDIIVFKPIKNGFFQL